jgi:hypothetical protein
MTTLDKVMQMQSQGMQDAEIVKKLRDEGISPKEIEDSFGQAKVKEAVSQEEQQYPGMEQSSMPEQTQVPEQQQGQEQQEQQYQEYPQYQQDYQQPQLDTDTISEIASQVVSEKFSEFNKKTGDLISFKNETQEKLKDLDERLRRIESSIENLQRSIIGKVGEFGDNMGSIHKDLDNLHGTMSKLMNPLIDNYRELKKISGGK